MKKTLLFNLTLGILLCGVFSSCEKAETNNSYSEEINNPAEQFAVILSKAVSSNQNLRAFLKEEALSQFDKDYDIFYPWTKDKVVSEGKSFREILKEYDVDNQLNEIEQQLPLLNILVPDWEWLDAFSVKTWDLNDEDIIVSFPSDNNEHPIVYQGELIGSLENGLFPTFPTLIIKDNERMTPIYTKAGEIEYDFSEDIYRPEPQTKINTRPSPVTSYIYPSTTPGSNYVTKTSFQATCPEAVAGWEEYGDDPYGAQRNYIYFSIPKGDTTGLAQNPKIRESIIAVRLNDTNCLESDSSDPVLHSVTYTDNDCTSETVLLNDLWSDGQLEIQIIATAYQNGAPKEIANNTILATGQEAFDIKLIKKEFYHKTALHLHREYVYTATKNNLVPKWIYLQSPFKFTQWHPDESSIISIHAYEKDSNTTIEVTQTIKEQNAISLTSKIGDKINFSFNYNGNTTETTVKQTTYKSSDYLGSSEITYNDYIIKSEKDGQYELNYYSTQNLDFIVVPMK